MENVRQLLGQVWGYSSFRPFQQQSIDCILQARDSLSVLPTGAGKSLCYQLPALAADGLAVVVSPLIALMKDQVDALRDRGVDAATVNSTQTDREKREVRDAIVGGRLKLLYLSPERLLSDRTLAFLRSIKLSYFAIDEAHCVSQWGHDFRPEYVRLCSLRKHFPDVSMHAFTATASADIQRDIVRQLGLASPEIIVGEFDRPNLIYRMPRRSAKLEQVTDVIRRHRGESGIVYCHSRREVDSLASALRSLGWTASPYHAGMSDVERHANQEAFLAGRCEILVATIAFGMGVDKPDVRYIVHTGMPRTLEHYQQESGRAGRDGLPAECVLLFGPRDFLYWKEVVGDEGAHRGGKGSGRALQRFYSLCNSVACRHRSIVEYFGQRYDAESCGACDVCLGELALLEDSVETAQKILACVMRLKEAYGAGHVASVLSGKYDDRIKRLKHHELSTFGALSDFSTMSIRIWISQLAEQAYLVSRGEYPTLALTDSGRRLMQGHGAPKLTEVNTKKSHQGDRPFVPAISSIAAFDHFRKGESVASVAGKMKRAESTVVKYLTDYVRFHGISDPSPWVAPAVAARVREHRHLAGSGKLKPLFDHFGGEIDYDSIRITLACTKD